MPWQAWAVDVWALLGGATSTGNWKGGAVLLVARKKPPRCDLQQLVTSH